VAWEIFEEGNMLTGDEVRRIVREELLGKGEVSVEFADLVRVETGDSGPPAEVDCAHERPLFCESTDDIVKFFQTGRDERELQKLNRSRMEPTRNAPPKSQPEPQSVEELFGQCEKRSSGRGTVKLTKRYIAETDEIMVEAWNSEGECVATRFISAGQDISEGSSLAKASISDSMLKTLAGLRSSLTPEEFEAAARAVKALDVDAFLQICRRAQTAA
jgi:hypothetical protein